MNFNQWFTVATKNIANSEIPNIRQELEVHVGDTIRAHLQTGLNVLESHDKAMQGLGDPKQAARGFAQSHLTVQEAKRLGLIPVKHDTLFLFGVIAATSAAMAYMFYVSRSRYGDLPVINTIHGTVLGFQAFGICNMLLAKLERELFKRNPVFRTFVLTSSLTNAVMLTGIYMLTRLPAPMTVPLYAAASIGVIAVFAWIQTELPILRKLRPRA